ncbi:hypothetical protein AX17_002854 [Amanita inopinata Kibby_2008]|nr:hypothetical protein AX17_002854 [Amanita inopinata Kibby_2008]
MAQFHQDIVLHVLPGNWGLPSIDPPCLAAVVYCQLTIPGKFSISECTNPDFSPTGQLPYLTHNGHIVALLPSIIKYISDLGKKRNNHFGKTDLDSGLNASQKSGQVAWIAHAEAHLGDLVYYMLYSVSSNWAGLTYPLLASMFPFPQRHFVPLRVQELYRPRLQVAGMWRIPEVEMEARQPFNKVSREAEKAANTNAILQAFEKEKVTEKARTILDIYARLLCGKYFMDQNSPSALDAVVAAHTLLLLKPPYPLPFIQQLLLESYPSLVRHAQQIFSETIDTSAPKILKSAPQKASWHDILPRIPWSRKPSGKNADERKYDRMRWSFFGLVAGCVVAYLGIVGRNVEIRIVGAGERVDEEDEADAEGGNRFRVNPVM